MPDDLPDPTKNRSHWMVERFGNFDGMRIAHTSERQPAGESMREDFTE